MPAKDDHVDQAKHNFDFFQSLDKETYSDWAVTVLFYTALHYIDAFLATQSIHPGSHDIRDKYVNRVSQLKPLYPSYSFLKNHSRNARYSPPTSFTGSDVSQLESVHLRTIRTSIETLLV